MKVQAWRDIFLTNKATELSGRYITLDHIEPLIKRYGAMAEIKVIGSSVQRRPIYALQCGKGPVKILMWSQMHGNESTTTKAVFDLLNTFNSTHGSQFLKKLQITIIPMLNPDGAKRYTRHNANDVDLNRDAKSLSQPESRALRTIFDKLQPDYCFNLHGQRTIYSAGSQPKSAILSFLAPAENDEREITETRKKAMSVIVAMNKSLQQLIPDHIALYSDTYNPNCVGDAFQSLKSITILFEAGHI
ncbi:MAG: peptidase M14, partial [Flavobacteriaceae bacterium]|nr:peptidase M14 [Flavobacteriaceae bacterium]